MPSNTIIGGKATPVGAGRFTTSPLSPVGAPILGGKSIAPYTPPTTAPKLNTRGSVPSTALTTPVTPTDVTTRRNQLQTLQDTAMKLQGMISGVNPTITPTKTIPNAESAALKYLNGDPLPQTETQKTQMGFLGEMRDKTKEFFSGREDQIDQAYKDSGVADARSSLAETRARKAERQVQLRNDLKSLETTSSERGVAREFALDRKNQINSEAYFDLANISIVESAQLGNLEQARTDAKDLIDQQFNSYDAYIKEKQAELDYLAPTLSAEQKQQADIAQFQLDQYKQQLQDAKDSEQKKYDYLAEAAKNGAPNSVTDAILKATTQDEAARLAAPYIGLLERQNTQSVIASRVASSAPVFSSPDGGGLSELFNIANLKGGVQARQKNEQLFNKYISEGNTEAAEKLVNSMVVNSLPVAQQNDFKQMGAIITMRERLRSKESKLQNTNPNLYTTALNSALPFVAVSKDKDWQSFVAETQSTVNQYRNNIFGASLTGNELAAANLSLPNWERDTFGDIVVKLNALEAYARNTRDSMVIDSTGQFTDVASLGGGQSSATYQDGLGVSIPGEDIFLNTVDPAKGNGYWGNLQTQAGGFFKSLFGY